MHMPSMFLRAKFRTPTWMKQERVVAATWAENIVRGGILRSVRLRRSSVVGPEDILHVVAEFQISHKA